MSEGRAEQRECCSPYAEEAWAAEQAAPTEASLLMGASDPDSPESLELQPNHA